jgi:sugar (pentulose or hexulose) kinase
MFIGLDLGTTNVKALLVGETGQVLARASEHVSLRNLPGNGVEQDIEEIFGAAIQALGSLSARADVSSAQSLGVSSQGGALLLLDEQGRPRGPVISWIDGRGSAFGSAFTRQMGADWLIQHIGCDRSQVALGQVLRLKQEQPGLINRSRIGFVGDHIVGRLCGRAAHDATSLSLGMLYNPTQRRADRELLDRLGIGEFQLPDLLSARQPAGALLEEVARIARLPAGIPVGPAVHDQYAAAMGVGATAAGTVMFGAGTAWVLLAVDDELNRPAISGTFTCTHVIDGLYGQIASMGNGGSAVSWAARLMGLPSAEVAAIDTIIRGVSAGSEGLMFWPLLAGYGGARLADDTAGRLTGLRLNHGQAHVLRSVVEGLCLELGRYLLMLRDASIPVERLLMCGGAAASQVTPQIVADVTGLEVACTTEPDTSALGAAMLARGMVQQNRPLADISAAMAPSFRSFRPGPKAAFYRELLERYIGSTRPVAIERTPA